MSLTPFVADRQSVADAQALIDQLGNRASLAAAAHARDARDAGNARRYCRWRQIERLIEVLALPEAVGTRH